ncbi:MAG: SDR family NAD(P)-dependent oxidoreductase [Kiritimatiellae bacterium]|nr:SDR family NAD(P)-dependent oxidoreductase [Kiritimatiellia bacterium]
MKRETRAYAGFFATRLVALAVDATVVFAAYLFSVFLRLSFNEPMWGWRKAAMAGAVVCVVHIASLALAGCYRKAWRRSGMIDLPRYAVAMVSASLVLAALRFVLPSQEFAYLRPPYTVAILTFVFASAGVAAVRLVWRAYVESREKSLGFIDRGERRFDNVAAARFIAGKTVMVTGAGGSIGSELSRQVAAAGAKTLILVDHSENALYEIDRENLSPNAVPVLANVGDESAMRCVFAKYRPEIVLHAAAYKHVPMVELNPDAGWKNNVDATKTLAALAKEHGVARFVLISTDKAVNPVSSMGKTKLAAEQAVMSMNEDGKTSFCAVRFGNVFGSSGSVVPLWREQIAKRLPVTVTHPGMRRYFMTIGEAVSLVLQASSRPERAIYTLDMGESVSMLDLAERMIREAGFRPYVDIPVVFTGMRPGEKLFEEIDVSEKSYYRTDMAKIYITR